MRSMNGLRTRPSPCSPESAPPNSSTRSATALAIDSNFFTPSRGLHVDHGPNVQAAHRSMRVNARGGVVRVDDFEKAPDERAQLLRRNRGVFHERDRLRVFLHRHRKTQRGFAQAPDLRLRRRIGFGVIVIAEAARAQICFERGKARRQVFFAVAIKLDAQHRLRIALHEAGANLFQSRVLARVVENGLVHHLDGGGLVRAGSQARRRAIPADRRRGSPSRLSPSAAAPGAASLRARCPACLRTRRSSSPD